MAQNTGRYQGTTPAMVPGCKSCCFTTCCFTPAPVCCQAALSKSYTQAVWHAVDCQALLFHTAINPPISQSTYHSIHQNGSQPRVEARTDLMDNLTRNSQLYTQLSVLSRVCSTQAVRHHHSDRRSCLYGHPCQLSVLAGCYVQGERVNSHA